MEKVAKNARMTLPFKIFGVVGKESPTSILGEHAQLFYVSPTRLSFLQLLMITVLI
jgi:hypothetical protein